MAINYAIMVQSERLLIMRLRYNQNSQWLEVVDELFNDSPFDNYDNNDDDD